MNWEINIRGEVPADWTLVGGEGGRGWEPLSGAAREWNFVPPVVTSAGILIPTNTYQLDPNWGGGNGGVTPGGPGGPGIRPVLFDGESTYHGFQAQIKKAMKHGLQGQLSYTLGQGSNTNSDHAT